MFSCTLPTLFPREFFSMTNVSFDEVLLTVARLRIADSDIAIAPDALLRRREAGTVLGLQADVAALGAVRPLGPLTPASHVYRKRTKSLIFFFYRLFSRDIFHVPGQGFILQAATSLAGPAQSAPTG